MHKKISAIIITLALVLTTLGTANARHNDGLEGLLLGAGSGAIIGQVIGRDAEGALVGSVIGGTIGLMIGLDRDHGVVVDRPRHVPQVRIVYNNRWDDRHNRWENRRHRRYDRHRGRNHRRHWRQERRHHRR